MLVDIIEGQRRHLEVCVSGRDHCRAGRDLMVLWTHGVSGGPQADDLLGAPFQDLRPRTSHLDCCSSQRLHHAPMGSGAPQPLRAVLWAALRLARGARVGTRATRIGAASGSTCLC